MENLTELLNQLATKLGTTTEYLWDVMIRQVYIAGMTHLVLYAILVFLVIGYFGSHFWLCKPYNKEDNWSRYDEYDENVLVPMIFAGVLLGILIIVAVAFIPNTITAFFNPEYWALESILDRL